MMAPLVNVNGGYPEEKDIKVSNSTSADLQDFVPPYARYEPLLELYKPANPLKEVDSNVLKEL